MATLEKQSTKLLFSFAYGNVVREICFGFSLNFVAIKRKHNFLIIILLSILLSHGGATCGRFLLGLNKTLFISYNDCLFLIF